MKNDLLSGLISGACFSERFNHSNSLSAIGFDRWLFYPGMLFDSSESWWGAGNPRPRPHEGIDLCLFRNSDNRIMRIGGGASVPAIADGYIEKIGDDYLAQSIFVRHPGDDNSGTNLYSFYAHVEAVSSLSPGDSVREGQVLAHIADVETSAPMYSHLHISLALIHGTLKSTQLDWSTIYKDPSIELHDPLLLLNIRDTLLPFVPEDDSSKIPMR